jgi:hypothetical protein
LTVKPGVKFRQVLSSFVKARQVLSRTPLGESRDIKGLRGVKGGIVVCRFSLGYRAADLPARTGFAQRASRRPRNRLPRILIIGKKMTRGRQRQRTLRLPSPASPSRRRRFARRVIGLVKCTVTVTGARKTRIRGNPDMAHASTSYAERNNLNVRMHSRRMTRLTNAFSKKMENHAHAMALHFLYYNFVRIHKTLKTTPAMAAEVTKRLWEVSDIVDVLDTWEISTASAN